MGLLGEDDPAPEPRGCQRRRTRAQPSPDDRDVCPEYLHTVSLADEAANLDRPGSSGRQTTLMIQHRLRRLRTGRPQAFGHVGLLSPAINEDAAILLTVAAT
jgi:hypothetical protein